MTRPAVHAAGFSYPVLTLRESALAGNLAAMAAYCARTGVELAPHGKTAMSPELAARQLASGAWGITVATIGQLRAYRAFGFPRLLMANELVDETGIAWLAESSPPTPASRRTATWTVPTAWPSWTGSSSPARPGAGSQSWWRSAWGGPAAGPMTRRSRWPRRPPRPAR